MKKNRAEADKSGQPEIGERRTTLRHLYPAPTAALLLLLGIGQERLRN
jgi:hypothetical protein